MAADVTEVAAKFDEEILELFDQAPLQVGLGVPRRKVEEFYEVAWHVWGRFRIWLAAIESNLVAFISQFSCACLKKPRRNALMRLRSTKHRRAEITAGVSIF